MFLKKNYDEHHADGTTQSDFMQVVGIDAVSLRIKNAARRVPLVDFVHRTHIVRSVPDRSYRTSYRPLRRDNPNYLHVSVVKREL